MKYSNLLKIFDRIISVVTYSFPFLELYSFFNPFLLKNGLSSSLLEDAAWYLKDNNWLNFLIFTILIALTQSKKINLSYFVRYNMMQSLIIMFLSSLFDTCAYLFPYFIRTPGSIGNLIFNVFCFLLMLLVIYCVIFAIRGKIPKIALLSEAVELQIWRE